MSNDHPIPERPWPPVWRGLFVGEATWGERFPLTAGPQQALLVLGPPRSGKTSAVVEPNVLLAPGAVVSTSTKTDVATWTANRRAWRGRAWLFDPSGTIDGLGLARLRWSPVTGCERWEVAADRAHALAGAANLGGLLRPDHWTERAEALLAPLLHAAALGQRSMASVLRWVLRREVREALELAWSAGGHELAADSLEGLLATDERELSGIFSTAANLLSAYRHPAALEVANEPNFDIDAFVRSSDTVYVCAPASEQEQLAPVVVAFLDSVRRATYAREPGWPPVLFVLDELANIAPLPGLPALVSEGGGQGLVTLACLQDLSQARARWGVAADGFLTLFGWKMVLPGVADLRTLQLVSALAGEREARKQSVTQTGNLALALAGGHAGASVTTSTERVPALPVDQVARLAPGAGLVLGPGTGPVLVRLVPAWEKPWHTVLTGGLGPGGAWRHPSADEGP